MSKDAKKESAAAGKEPEWNLGSSFLKRIRLDPENLGDKESMSLYMKQAVELPEWFGSNLDALADALCEITDETVFEVKVGDRDEFARDGYPKKVLKVISRAVSENPHLSLYLTDPLWQPGEAVGVAAEESPSRERSGGEAAGNRDSETDITWTEECCDWSDDS